MLSELLATIVKAFKHTKCMSLTNQKYAIQPTLINLNPNQCNQELHYYPFLVKLNKCPGSCDNLNLMTYLKAMSICFK